MNTPKVEVPTELRNLAERAIEQTEQAFGMFFDAANKSVAAVPLPTMELSKRALILVEENLKEAFSHAKKVAQTSDPQEAVRIQAEFLKSKFQKASEQITIIADEVMAAAKNATKAKP